MLRTILLVVGVGLAGAAAGIFGYPYVHQLTGGGDKEKQQKAADAKAEALATVTSLGRLEPESEIIEIGATPGSRIDHMGEKVKEGAFVEKGDPLAYLDSYPELLAARDLAQSQLKEARERLKAETAFGNASVSVAKLKIRQAREVLPKQIEAQEAEVRRSRAELDKCGVDLVRADKMLKDTAIAQSQHDSVKLLHRQCIEQLDRNKATLEHLKSDQEIKTLMAEAELISAEAGLKRAELSTLVDSLTAAAALAQVRLDQSIVKAPIAGEIIKIHTRAGESVSRNPILKLGNTKTMYAIAEVYETDVRFVRAGQKAVVTSKAFPDEKLTGVVERVGSLVHKNDVLNVDPTKDADRRVIEVRIRLDASRVAARFNYLQVDVTIHRDSN